jgi:hypothetical protein
MATAVGPGVVGGEAFALAAGLVANHPEDDGYVVAIIKPYARSTKRCRAG